MNKSYTTLKPKKKLDPYHIYAIFLLALICSNSSTFAETKMGLPLMEGANKYESKAIASALSDKLAADFKFYVDESHFISGPSCFGGNGSECRGNLNYEVKFRTASVDLNQNGIDEVIVYYDALNVCGSSGCGSFILQNKNDYWGIIGEFFPGHTVAVSHVKTNGFSDIIYQTQDNQWTCVHNGDYYQC
jgi:hypothetical protein